MSRTSDSIFGVLDIIRFKDRVDFLNPKRSKRIKTPVMSQKHYKTTTMLIQNRTVCTIEPVESAADSAQEAAGKTHIVFFHGGGYSMEASGLHFQLMKTLMKQTGCPLTYVDYPLAPEHTVMETIGMCFETYVKLLELHPSHRFVFVGDSAGGGLALALAMKIRDEGLVGPTQLILFSPWLDLTLSNEKIPPLEDRDVILGVAALQEIGARYCGDIPKDHYLASPKSGNLAGLGQIAVFYGTEEILYPDCLEFCQKAAGASTANSESTAGAGDVAGADAGVSVTGFEYKGMQHDWVLLPMEEAKKAIAEACELIRGGNPSA